MKKPNDKKRTNKPPTAICVELDCHKWATKMEIIRLVSGKPDLKLKATPA